MLNHNKKRNVGLVSEFFAKHIATSLLDQKYDSMEKAKNLYAKYFFGNTEISKEWKLFEALHKTNVKSKESAVRLIEKVKQECQKSLGKKLDEEKTQLVHDINNKLGDKEFFSRSVGDYKTQATIQVLLNTWRTGTLNESLGEVAGLEDSLLTHLTENKVPVTGDASYLELTSEEVDALVLKIMTEKFMKKFDKNLTEEQRNIISTYVFAEEETAKAKLTSLLDGLKTETLSLIESINASKKIETEDVPEFTLKKLTGIKNLLLNEYKDTQNLTDDRVAFYMTLTKLREELKPSSHGAK